MTARKPESLKRLDGTARQDRAGPSTPGLHALHSVPEAPQWMRVRAAKEFDRLAAAMHANRLLSAGNVALLENYCCLVAHLSEMWEMNIVPKSAALLAARAMAVSLNLTHVAPAAPPTKENPFNKHKAGRPPDEPMKR